MESNRIKTLAALTLAATAAVTAIRVVAQSPRPSPIYTEEGRPIDRRPPQLDTDYPVFEGQTHAPYHKTVDVAVGTVATNLDNPWAVVLLPSGRFLITEKPGRLRILTADGTSFQTIATNLSPIHVRGQAGLLDVALDRNFRTNRRIFFTYVHDVDTDNPALTVASGVLNEEPARCQT